MTTERRLEYLTLRCFINDNIGKLHHYGNMCNVLLPNKEYITISAEDLKKRITELELDLIQDYIIKSM